MTTLPGSCAARSAALLLLVATLLLAGCGGGEGGGSVTASGDTSSVRTPGADGSGGAAGGGDDVAARDGSYDTPPTERLDPAKAHTVVLDTDAGAITITLLPELGPIAAANFAFLTKEGFYDGTVFHRTISGFMIQGGDPLGDGTGGPGYEIADDPVKAPYVPGTVAMANAGPGTGGSQFFIVHGDSVGLEPNYSIFGRVTAGMDVVDRIAKAPVEMTSSGEPSDPEDPTVVRSARLTSR